MAWEPRGNGQYWYKPARLNGQPRKIYLGTGVFGRAHEVLERQHQRRRQEARELYRTLKLQAAEADAAWQQIWSLARGLAASSMVLAGWYNHRGEWRKVMEKARKRQNRVPSVLPASTESKPESQLQFESLTARANAGEPGARTELQRFLEAHPVVWQTLGDLTRASVLLWTQRLMPTDAGYGESIARNLEEWKKELLGPDATPTERALADVAVSAKLALSYAESQAEAKNTTLQAVRWNAKRLDMAQHRLNRTLKMLAQVQMARRTQQEETSGSEVKPVKPRLHVADDPVAEAG